MPSPKKDSQKQPSQSERFEEAARQLGCDEDEAAFDEKLRRLGKAKAQSEKRERESGRKDQGGH